jgi:hypothetical protein
MQNIGYNPEKNGLRISVIAAMLLMIASASFALVSASASVNVTLAVSPTSSSFPPGGSPSETLTVTNNLHSPFIGKTCNLEFTGPFKGKMHATCPTDFQQFTVKPGTSFTHFYKSFPFRIPAKTPKGAYHFTLTVGGTVNGAPVTTMPTTFEITVT